MKIIIQEPYTQLPSLWLINTNSNQFLHQQQNIPTTIIYMSITKLNIHFMSAHVRSNKVVLTVINLI